MDTNKNTHHHLYKGLNEQDRWLPLANENIPNLDCSGPDMHKTTPVDRIMKTALPKNAKVSKEAKECMQECVSEFISFVASEAAEKVLNEKRKTVVGEDILLALKELGFENYEMLLKQYLSKYRETLGIKRPFINPQYEAVTAQCNDKILSDEDADHVLDE